MLEEVVSGIVVVVVDCVILSREVHPIPVSRTVADSCWEVTTATSNTELSSAASREPSCRTSQDSDLEDEQEQGESRSMR